MIWLSGSKKPITSFCMILWNYSHFQVAVVLESSIQQFKKIYIPPSFFFVTLILLIWIANRVSSLPTATCVSSNSEWMNLRTFFQKHFLRLILSSFLFNIQCWWTKKLVIYWILILILLTLLFHSSYLFFLSSD